MSQQERRPISKRNRASQLSHEGYKCGFDWATMHAEPGKLFALEAAFSSEMKLAPDDRFGWERMVIDKEDIQTVFDGLPAEQVFSVVWIGNRPYSLENYESFWARLTEATPDDLP